jgi:hypothetical protein
VASSEPDLGPVGLCYSLVTACSETAHGPPLCRYILYDEWLVAMLEWRSVQEDPRWEAWVEKAFSRFDVDGTGVISRRDLSTMLCKGDECTMPDTVAAALRCAPPPPPCMPCMHAVCAEADAPPACR